MHGDMKISKFLHFPVTLIPAVLYLFSCNSSPDTSVSEDDRGDGDNVSGIVTADSLQSSLSEQDSVAFSRAIASLYPASDSELTGTATFRDFGDGKVTFRVQVRDITPGEHAVHIHENGDCTAPDASSAGGHWSPQNNDHGKRNVDLYHHKGDIGNIRVQENGSGELTMTVLGWSVGGPDSTNILGKALVIHEGADDFSTQPGGGAGARIGCGVITEVE
jgi:Cu-Zn family superoxide dismutase